MTKLQTCSTSAKKNIAALLESKDMELVEKESELNLLRAQMEELRNQTRDGQGPAKTIVPT